MKQLIFNTSDFIKSDTAERRVEKFEGDIGYSSNIAVGIKAVKILIEIGRASCRERV